MPDVEIAFWFTIKWHTLAGLNRSIVAFFCFRMTKAFHVGRVSMDYYGNGSTKANIWFGPISVSTQIKNRFEEVSIADK